MPILFFNKKFIFSFFISVSYLAQAAYPQAIKATHYGEASLDKFGSAIISLGDITGDGKADYAVGAPETDIALNDRGTVFFYNGATQAELGRYQGATAQERAGFSLALVSDIDGDSFADLAVGAPFFNGAGGNEQGKVIIVSTNTFTQLTSFTVNEAGAHLGWAIANAGDRNGDGKHDLIIGAPDAAPNGISNAGSVFVLAVSSPPAMTQLSRLDGTVANEAFGMSVASIASVDGDANDEIAVGSPNYTATFLVGGRVQVFSGATGHPRLTLLEGDNDFEQFGWQVAQIEDPDGGIAAHLAVSTPGDASGAQLDTGGALIFDLPAGNVVRAYGSQVSGSLLGISMAVVNDQDNDGIDDLLLGSPFDSSGGVFLAGVVELISVKGSGGFMAKLFRITGETGGDRCGAAVAKLGDINNDGRLDYAWSCDAGQHPVSQIDGGLVEIITGKKPRLQLDKQNYVDQEPFTLAGVGYANKAITLIAFFNPGGTVIINGLSLDADGGIVLNAKFPNANGTPYTVDFQFFFLNPNGMGLLGSEVAHAMVN